MKFQNLTLKHGNSRLSRTINVRKFRENTKGLQGIPKIQKIKIHCENRLIKDMKGASVHFKSALKNKKHFT